MKKKRWICLLLACALALSACGSKEKEEEDSGIIRLTYAVLNEKAAGEAMAEARRFNSTHMDVKVDVKEYYNKGGRRGKDLLLTEIMAGKIPDIIHLGDDLSSDRDPEAASRLSYYVLARKGYLEDLWPYIENDPDLGREGVIEAPLKAAEVDGGLYTIFGKVKIRATVVSENFVGDRETWTLQEMQELFQALPEDAVMFPYWVDREYALRHVFANSIETYIDRDNGTCDFNNDNFKAALEFVRGFPTESERTESAEDELADQIRSGLLMQYPFYIANSSYVQWADMYLGYGGQVRFLGVPTEDGSSGIFYELGSRPIAMSSACQNKEAAWEFMRGTLLPQYKNYDEMNKALDGFSCLPVNRADYDLVMRASLENKHDLFVTFGSLPYSPLHRATKENVARFEDLMNRAEGIDLCDEDVLDIIREVAGAYFAGDKTLDEAAQLIQNRVTLYVNEVR